MATSFENLTTWKSAINLATRVYEITRKFPKDELFGLSSQMRRAAVSISSNIAEGSGRDSKAEFERFVNISIGSLNELESQVLISKNLEFIDMKEYDGIRKEIRELGNLLGGFKKYLHK